MLVRNASMACLGSVGSTSTSRKSAVPPALARAAARAAPPAWQEPQPTVKKNTAAGLPSGSRRLVPSIVDTVRDVVADADVRVLPVVVVCEPAPYPAMAAVATTALTR